MLLCYDNKVFVNHLLAIFFEQRQKGKIPYAKKIMRLGLEAQKNRVGRQNTKVKSSQISIH